MGWTGVLECDAAAAPRVPAARSLLLLTLWLDESRRMSRRQEKKQQRDNEKACEWQSSNILRV